MAPGYRLEVRDTSVSARTAQPNLALPGAVRQHRARELQWSQAVQRCFFLPPCSRWSSRETEGTKIGKGELRFGTWVEIPNGNVRTPTRAGPSSAFS